MAISIPGLPNPIDGDGPIVLLGANGSGKTRLAVQMANSGSAEFIPALRNIAVPDQIPNWTLQTATNELQNRTNQRRNTYWELVADIDALFGKLWSSHAVEAMRVYDEVLRGAQPQSLPETVLTKTKELWRVVFPGRSIAFTDFTARVTNEYLGSTTYTAKHMSDGERTGLYLAGRVFDSAHPVVIVDEPETHFHSRLAVRFWDALESLSPSKRFVYVTHDLNFALSRRDAATVLVRPNQPPERVVPGASLPSDDVASILGAASFSVYASRLIFCEGREEKSLDQELLRAWFSDRETALIPVGGCENVKRCTAAFQTKSVVSGFAASGIVDRDHWPDELLTGLANVHVLPVHEIESLYVLKAVYSAIAVQAGHKAETVEGLYANAFGGFKRQMAGTLANKLICERFKARSLMLVERAFASTVDFTDRAGLRSTLISEIPRTAPAAEPEKIWDEEERLVNAALASDDPSVFLRVLPGKPLIGTAAATLGISKERYCELLKIGLGSSSDPAFQSLHTALEIALAPYLPPRRASGAPG
ncbi:MAG: ATP-dependent nuclease [Burkholderiales bacterium]|jgi:ABC-type cobalamin/Fe3+-siderophores transport system ATPase subunit|nr:AAA family ATPase [Burkholderiales bacterium]MCZ8100098.1 AAA family ATPase [Burkholderiales bacterium]MCZ8321811.1 AAA family ATPase [Novosphingobium sp.]